MEKRTGKSVFFLFLFFILTVLPGICGCGAVKEKEEKEMGRYTEEDASVPDMLYDLSALQSAGTLQDGTMACTILGQMYLSRDQGNTWEMGDALDLSQIGSDEYDTAAAASLDYQGNILFVRNVHEEGEEENKKVPYKDTSELWIYSSKDKTYSQIPGLASELTVSGSRKVYAEDEIWQEIYDYLSMSDSLDSNETVESLKAQYESLGISPEEMVEGLRSSAHFGLNITESLLTEKSVFLLIDSDNILQIDRITGEKQNSYYFSWLDKGLWTVVGERLYTADAGEIRIFDTETGEEISGREKEAFGTLNDSSFHCLGASKDQSTLYLVCTSGLYSHKVGSDSLNQLVEGSMSSLCVMDQNFKGIMECGNGGFFLFSVKDGMPVGKRFIYDPDMPRYPDKELSLYSVNEIWGMDVLISRFQSAHPDIHVSYSYGKKDGSDSVTTSDALKVLNTKILAGDGPDFLFMDNMPVETYARNGMLESVDDVIQKENGKVFEKIASGVTRDGHTYAVPLFFQMPVMLGYRQEVENIHTLDQLLEFSEKIGSDKNDMEMVTDQTNAKGTLATMYISNSSMIFNEDGSLNSEELTRFLKDCREIYDLSGERKAYIIRKQEEELQSLINEVSDDMGDDWYSKAMDELDATTLITNVMKNINGVFFRQIHYTMGTLSGGSLLNLYLCMKEDPDFIMKAIPGNKENCYVGRSFVGVNSQGKNKENAKEFLSFLLSEEGQEIYKEATYSSDFPVNRISFLSQVQESVKEELEYRQTDENQGALICENEDGTVDSIPFSEPDQNFYDQLAVYADSLEEPMYNNLEVFNTIAKMGEPALKGEQSVEEAAENIIDKMELYLSE